MITALRFWAGTGAFAIVWTALAIRSGVFLSSPRSIELAQDAPFNKKLGVALGAFFILCIITAFFIFPAWRVSFKTLPETLEKNLQSYKENTQSSTLEPLLGVNLYEVPPKDKWSAPVICPLGASYVFGSRDAMRIKMKYKGGETIIRVPETPEAYDFARADRIPDEYDQWLRKVPYVAGQVVKEDIIFQFQSISKKEIEVAFYLQ